MPLLPVRSRRFFYDWTLLLPAVLLALLGILTISPFAEGAFASRQLIFLGICLVAYFILAAFDMSIIRRTVIVMALYGVSLVLLVLLLLFADPISGAQAWFTFGPVSFQPADLAKFSLIILLAKYLSRRHVEIGDWRHILVSGAYAFGLILLILLEPDMGNAIIFGTLWLALMLVSGISKKHLAVLGALLIVSGSFLWFEALQPYQRARIISFVNPASDIQGSGYSAYQAKITVGSGELFGKGLGYGTQSKLRFLPEYQTDFIFAAFAEEWGFVGVTLLLSIYGLLFTRLIQIARAARTNFDAFFTLGVLILFASHLTIHAGISLGLLPVTGTTIPFMSAGGSHLLLEFTLLGIVTSLARGGAAVRDIRTNEFEGG